MVAVKKKKRIFALSVLEKALRKNNREYIWLYFKGNMELGVKSIVSEDSFDVILDDNISKLRNKVDYNHIVTKLNDNSLSMFRNTYEEIGIGIENSSRTSLSKVTRTILGPIVNPDWTTINYNVYVEMYIRKEDLLNLDDYHRSLFEGYSKESFIQLQDYINIINKSKNTEYNLIKEDYSIKDREDAEEKDIKYDKFLPKQMISHIYNYIDSKGFIFDIEDIGNLYLSMKTKPFVLMAGISGTGKSKLVELFANAIGANDENGRYRMISVKPDWNDGTELFGYMDINGDYVPGILTEIAYDANKEENLNKPYIICLDEMNLARVEYYLSDYLSIIESRYWDGSKVRTRRIFPRGYFKSIKSSNKYEDVYFSDNMILVGTVNMDDTTFAFSEKVLDRANTIEFSKVDLDFLDFEKIDIPAKSLDNSNFKTSYLTIKDAVFDEREFVDRINRKIVDINDILKKYNRHFAYRVRDEIVFYMLENNKENIIGEDEAFDYQILQKILPRIQGSDYEIKLMLIELYNHLNDRDELIDRQGYLDDIDLDRTRYRKSSRKIIDMLRGYENGYVSFW